MALVAGAPNAKGGKAFMDFILSKDAQTVVAELGRRPVRADVASNPLLVPLSKINAISYDFGWAASNRARIVEAWGEKVLDLE